MLRGVYTERSACAQHDRAVTYTDVRIILLICIIGPSQPSRILPLIEEIRLTEGFPGAFDPLTQARMKPPPQSADPHSLEGVPLLSG